MSTHEETITITVPVPNGFKLNCDSHEVFNTFGKRGHELEVFLPLRKVEPVQSLPLPEQARDGGEDCHMNDAEEKQLIEELIAHDRSLTAEQRRAERADNSRRMMLRKLERMQKHVAANSPEFLMAMEAHNLYRLAWSMWPNDMLEFLGDDLIEEARRRASQCVKCGSDLPMPFCGKEYCAECEAEFESIQKEFDEVAALSQPAEGAK